MDVVNKGVCPCVRVHEVPIHVSVCIETERGV